jgi:predicted transposase/invertase (TIGR01784 family)
VAKLETDLAANREYKDTVFSLLFGNKDVLIPLSNSILGTSYGPDTEVIISTIRKGLTKSGINDLSFILDKKLIVLIEHQSTINENMPYRMLQYITETYKRLHEEEDEYRKRIFTLQRPKFIVLYNGAEEMPEDMRILRLSDMFPEYKPEEKAADDGLIDLELTVKMYNINRGHNEKMVKSCATLYEYGIFIDMIREYQKQTVDLGEAIQMAVVDCIDRNVLKKFLLQHKGEVVNMLTSDWDMDVALKVEREEGMEIGAKNERIKNASAMIAEGMDVDTVSRITGLTVDDILRL